MNRRLCLIVNPSAGGGRGRSVATSAAAELASAGAEHEVVESGSLDHARELAAQAVARDEVVVAVGGDGMAGALAGATCAAGGRYSLIPAGRGNDLACVLGVPKDPAAAARALLGAQPRQIDLIGVTALGRTEVIVAGSVYAGLPAVAGQVANETRLIGGALVYPVAALRVLAGWRPTSFGVRVAGAEQSYDFEGYAVVVANSAYFGAGMRVAPAASIEDGELDLVLMRRGPKLTFVRALLKIKDGSHVTLPQISLHRGTDVTLTMDRDLPAAADGEALAGASPLPAGEPLRIRVLPAALEVLTPTPACY